MSKTRVLIPALLGAALSASGAHAAPATQEGADKLKAVLERYLGKPAPGEAAGVTVTPQGPDYRTSFDLKLLAHALEPFGVTIEPATSTLMLTSKDDGTWQVAADAFPPLVVHYNGQTLGSTVSTYKFAGTFDPKIPGFAEASGTQDGNSFDQEAPAMSQHRRIGHAAASQTAVATEASSAKVDVHYTFADVSDTVVIRAPAAKPAAEGAPAPAPAPAPTEIAYTLATGQADVSADRLRIANLLDVWAFLVAHPNQDSLSASQDEFRGLLRAALPLLGGLKQNGSVNTLSLTTPTGTFAASKFAASLELANLAAAGSAAFGFNVDGLSIPSTAVPAWSTGLIPTAADLKLTLVGFHFDEAAKQAVEAFDIKKGFTPEQRDRIGRIAWPGDGRAILAPSHITSGLLDVRLDGDATIGAAPSGRLTITVAGLDKAIAALQSAGASDPSAAQMLAQFVLAKNLAKPGPDGSLIWLLEASGAGPLTVNGAALN